MRHKLSVETISLSDSALFDFLVKVEKIEARGQWFTAGEAYFALAKTLSSNQSTQAEAAKAFVRSATCFELAIQNRDAAHAYFEGASILYSKKISFQYAGELFNRAALNFKSASEFFRAGDAYRRAAIAFIDSPTDKIHIDDNIPPLAGAGKYAVAGICYNAAADAFLMGNDLAWARATYWEAGKMYLKQQYGNPAYTSFRKALVACIRFDLTHEGDQLRKALPMSNKEREEKVDPIGILEQASHLGHQLHQELNKHIFDSDWVKLMTDKDMISGFHEFYLEFEKIGNFREATKYYLEERKRQRKVFWREKKIVAALSFWIWEITCGYGENLWRWSFMCFCILFGFTAIYCSFGLIAPVTSYFDYFYFSLVTFTNFGYGDIHPCGVIAKILVSVEFVLGIFMLGMLLTYISRRFFR